MTQVYQFKMPYCYSSSMPLSEFNQFPVPGNFIFIIRAMAPKIRRVGGVTLRWSGMILKKQISHIPQCTCPIFHSTPFQQKCAHFCSGFVRLVYCAVVLCLWIVYAPIQAETNRLTFCRRQFNIDFFNEMFRILIQISQKSSRFALRGPISIMLSLVQIMGWRQSIIGTNDYVV